MLRKCPQFRLPELLEVFKDYPYLRIMVKNILRSKSGNAFVDKVKKPELVLLDFKVLAFIGGSHDHPLANELLKLIPENKLLVFPNEDWIDLVKEKLVLITKPINSVLIYLVKNLVSDFYIWILELIRL